MCILVVSRFIRAGIGAYVQQAREGRIWDESWRWGGGPMGRVLVVQVGKEEGMIEKGENHCKVLS